MSDKVQTIVLAAGHGKRMGVKDLPKVLLPIDGKPMIARLLAAIERAGVGSQPVIVVGQQADKVKAALGPDYLYITQPQQLGTGDAIIRCKNMLQGKSEHVLVLYGDHPLLSAVSIRKLVDTHIQVGATLTLATVKIPDFADWRSCFLHWGRILRDEQGNVTRVVEYKDATAEQKQITEVNPSFFVFRADWLWNNISRLTNDNAQHEYYLPDLVQMAMQEHESLTTIAIDPREAPGINTPQELELISALSK